MSLQELAKCLHEEKQIVKSEQDLIWKLNEQLQQCAEDLSHSFWLTRQHYMNLNNLILNMPQANSQRANQLEVLQFVDAYKELGYQESMYSQFLEAFINNPTLAAACLAYGDKLSLPGTTQVARIIVLCCYGNNIVANDYKHLLELMETLMLLQLTNELQPRRLLQKGSSAFCVVFRLFVESLLAGKLFLTSALHQPIMEILTDEDLFLETNSDKIRERLTAHEFKKRFGSQDDTSFKDKLKEHVQKTEQAIVDICSFFITSLLESMACFPPSLGWIISRAYNIVKDSGLVSQNEARALCTDILLQQFVCPCILNPELYGVTGDVPVSELGRFNLMQVAQVLQVMAHTDENNQQSSSFYSRLDRSAMHQLLDGVIGSSVNDVTDSRRSPRGHVSTSVFFTASQLTQLIQFLKDIQQSDVRGVDQSSLSAILAHLPAQPPPCMLRTQPSPTVHSRLSESSRDGADRGLPISGSAGDLIGSAVNVGTPSKRKNKTRGKKLPRKEEGSMSDSALDESGSGDNTSHNSQQDEAEVVLVISLPTLVENAQDMPGTLTENEVMELCKSESEGGTAGAGQLDEAEAERLEKRSRFSLYSGASDLSEAGEELPTEDGISRTSGSSSLDLDPAESVQRDDVSSIHAASSHGNQDEEDEEEGGDQASVTHANNDEALKALRRKLPTSRESIEDKMRKFEIRQELGVRFADPGVTGPRRDDPGQPASADTRSETWSVDVYASDSEPPAEQESQSERLREIAEDPAEHIRGSSAPVGSFLTLTRDEDSRSDVWSVEVLPSDSEPPDIQSEVRLQEFESEPGAAPPEDVLEDNRSRASTPSLSAASGFSGVSALSIVSDINQVKAGEEQWPMADRGFGKGPSSISPDVDDFMQRTEGGSGGSSRGGGSSNSSEVNDRSRPHSSSPRFQDVSSGHAPVDFSSRARNDLSDPLASKTDPRSDLHARLAKASLDARSGKAQDDGRKKAPEGAEKSVAWNIPERDDAGDAGGQQRSPVSQRLPVMDFDEHINTIKRSPYKRQKETSSKTSDHDAESTPIHRTPTYAWDENPPESSTPAPSSDRYVNGETSMANHAASSAFLPFKTGLAPSTQEVLQVFDPLHVAAPRENGDLPKGDGTSQSKPVETGGSPINLSLMTGSVLDDQKAKTPVTFDPKTSSLPSAERKTKETPRPPQVKALSLDYDSQELTPRGSAGSARVDRKKSWWRRPTFGRRKVPAKYGNSFDVTSPLSPGSPKIGASFDSQASDESGVSGSVPESPAQSSLPGEDIMQKYMRKVTSNQHQQTNGDSEANESRDSQSLSEATCTTAQSPLSDSTVATATRGGSSSSASSSRVNDWRASSSGHVAPKTDDTFRRTDSELRKDAKRKLRIVLSSTRPSSNVLANLNMTSQIALLANNTSPQRFQNRASRLSENARIKELLMLFLHRQHAEALLLQDDSRIAQLNEVKRCVVALDEAGCHTVMQNLWRDYKKRQHYLAYLFQSKQHLLARLSHISHVMECTERDRSICRRYYTAQCVRLFLKQREASLVEFRSKILNSDAMDEKVSLVNGYLDWLSSEMSGDRRWEGASEEQLAEALSCVERSVFTHIHKHVIFPNGDADILRDQLFQQHISRLSAVLTPLHPSLLVRRKYLCECPWPSAQRQAIAVAAHKSPRGKLDCALRCCRAVMHLLKLADESEAPGADDFTPVLVFVLIKANPPHLLSTVQYVNSFLESNLSGEDAYWWMQFTAATEFIKTIDERK